MDKQGKAVLFIAALVLGILIGTFVMAGKGGGKGGGKGPASQCNDHIDNDGDGTCDFLWKKAFCTDGSVPGDSDCTSKDDNDEFGSCIPSCETNSDCGISGYIDGLYCGADGNVYRDYQSFTCENAGKCTSVCNSQILNFVWQNCNGFGCFNGQCGNETNTTV